MKALAIALIAASTVVGAAHAETTDKQFLTASYCNGLAGSENLGKVDTTSLEAFLRAESPTRSNSVKISGVSKAAAARRKADGANASQKAKLIAERDQTCAPFFSNVASK